MYRGAGKSLARPGRKQARKHVRDARNFNNIETRAVIKLLFLQGKAQKEIHAILTETLACFLPSRAKDLSAPLYNITAAVEILMLFLIFALCLIGCYGSTGSSKFMGLIDRRNNFLEGEKYRDGAYSEVFITS